MSGLLAVLLLGIIIFAFGVFLLVVSGNLGPKKHPSKAKMMPYECGIQGSEKADSKISIKFYLTAILFILFDIEIIFMYPWALVYKDLLTTNAVFIFSEMMVFMAILLFGLFYVWKSGALEWE